MDTSTQSQRRSWWLKKLYQWHWISASMCIIGMLLFSATGITLNHASKIESRPRTVNKQDQLPSGVLTQLAAGPASKSGKQSAALPEPLRAWMADKLLVDVGVREAEWSPEEVYLAMPRPGGDAWVRIDRASGALEYESTDRGWISYLNDLHKGRHTGIAWSLFIDLFAAACLFFSITGLFIMKMHASHRPSTWPLIGFGLVLPLLLAILFIH